MKLSGVKLQTLAEQMLTLSWLETELRDMTSFVQFGTWADKFYQDSHAASRDFNHCMYGGTELCRVDLWLRLQITALLSGTGTPSVLVINTNLIFW